MTAPVIFCVGLYKLGCLYVSNLLPVIVTWSLCTQLDTHKDQSVHSALNNFFGTTYIVVSLSNTKQVPNFNITPLQSTSLTWIFPSKVRLFVTTTTFEAGNRTKIVHTVHTVYLSFCRHSNYLIAREKHTIQIHKSRRRTLIFKRPPNIQAIPPHIAAASVSFCHSLSWSQRLFIFHAPGNQHTKIPFTFLKKYFFLVSTSTTNAFQAAYFLRICIQKFVGLYCLHLPDWSLVSEGSKRSKDSPDNYIIVCILSQIYEHKTVQQAGNNIKDGIFFQIRDAASLNQDF
jgi:hypothetical protein